MHVKVPDRFCWSLGSNSQAMRGGPSPWTGHFSGILRARPTGGATNGRRRHLSRDLWGAAAEQHNSVSDWLKFWTKVSGMHVDWGRRGKSHSPWCCVCEDVLE